MAFTPDASRVFVAEKSGRIRAYDGLTDATPVTVVADLSRRRSTTFGIAACSAWRWTRDYPAKPYLYALYTYDSVLNDWHIDTELINRRRTTGPNTDWAALAMGPSVVGLTVSERRRRGRRHEPDGRPC